MINISVVHDALTSNYSIVWENNSMSIYLYVKTHNNTGLKYLGVTTAKDPHKYSGSGVYWKCHLNKHGYDYSTEILKECETKEEIKEWGLYYSYLWNIVESKEWANLKEEQGDGGRQSEEVRKKISAAGKGRSPWNKGVSMWSDAERAEIGERNRARGKQSLETIEKRTAKTTGKKRTDEQKKNISKSQKGRSFTNEHKLRLKEAAQNRTNTPWNKGLIMSTPSATAKTFLIENTDTNEKFEVYSLRKWCLENDVNYGVFHSYIKKGKPYKNYTAQEVK